MAVPQQRIIHVMVRRMDKGVIHSAQSACRDLAGKP